MHARTPWSGREGKQVGLSKAFIPFYAEFPESSKEGELVTSAALIFDGKPIVCNHVHIRFPYWVKVLVVINSASRLR